MKKIFLIALILFTIDFSINSQTIQQISKCDSATIMLTEKEQGFGPKGNMSYGFGSMDTHDSIELLAYPKMKNLPDSISDLKEYCIILNSYQFYYQNYRNGVYSKDFFLNKVNGFNWNLGDTVYLTKKVVKNTITVAAGYNSNKTRVYIIDANNNNDFSDDTLRILYSDLYNQDDILNNSYYVDCEIFDGISVKKDKILLNVKVLRSNNNELDLTFSFPEIRYTKIKYDNRVYLICKETYNPDMAIYVLLDKPYFSSVSKKYEIKPNQYINLGNDFYVYLPYFESSGIIKIKKASISKGKFNEQVAENNKNKFNRKSVPISNQVGMIAPSIAGLNIISDSVISLKKYLGKYVFLDFWATYCGPCIMEFPILRTVYEKYDKSQFEIIGIVNDQTNGKIKQFLNDKNVIWTNISMKISTTNIRGYDINSYPTSYLIAPDGKIISTNLRGEDLMNKLEMLKVKKN